MMRVKICGITSLGDALLAVKCGAWALGFNFYAGSPRYIQPGYAAEIIRQLPPEVVAVGVFVNVSVERLRCILRETIIQVIQCEEVVDDSIKVPIIKVVRAHLLHDFHLHECMLLVDSYCKERMGGTGQVANWAVAKQLARKYPTILAGGLHAGNVEAAIKTVRPAAIDVCTGVEESPGKKCEKKMREFFNAITTRRY